MVRAAADGDEHARSTFSRIYLPAVRRYLDRRWGSSVLKSSIDDALQDVFIEFLKPGGALESASSEGGAFRGLLYSVVRNVARRYEEKRFGAKEVSPGSSAFFDEVPEEAATLSRVFDRSWARALLAEAILQYANEAKRGDKEARRRSKVLRMRHRSGLPIREIASRINEPRVESVHQLYRRARNELHEHLRRVVAVHTGARGDAIERECERIAQLISSP